MAIETICGILSDWRDVARAEGLYKVSRRGDIVSLARRGVPRDRIVKPLRGHIRNGKPESVCISIYYADGTRQRRAIHAIVLEAFVGPRPRGMQIRHLNGDAADNRLENLRYGTARDNAKDAESHGTASWLRRGEEHNSCKYTNGDYARIYNLRHGGKTYLEISRTTGIPVSMIGGILRNDRGIASNRGLLPYKVWSAKMDAKEAAMKSGNAATPKKKARHKDGPHYELRDSAG